MSKLTDPAWWKAAVLRALYTAIAIAIPYIAAVQFADVPGLLAASAATVGAILSFATSLFGLPESVGVDLPWWLAALERVTKTFGQSLAAGLTGAVLLSDVDWPVVLQAALGAAFISLLRLILATLPANPSAQPVVVQNVFTPRASGVPGTLHVDESGIVGREPDRP
jgi:hypothetical protein